MFGKFSVFTMDRHVGGYAEHHQHVRRYYKQEAEVLLKVRLNSTQFICVLNVLRKVSDPKPCKININAVF